MDAEFLSGFWNMLSDYVAEDLPITILGSFLVGYPLMLLTAPEYFLKISFFDRIIQGTLVGTIPVAMLSAAFFHMSKAAHDTANALNNYISIDKYTEIKTEKEEIRKEATSLTIVFSLLISAFLMSGYWLSIVVN